MNADYWERGSEPTPLSPQKEALTGLIDAHYFASNSLEIVVR
jgi:hypothetical protein